MSRVRHGESAVAGARGGRALPGLVDCEIEFADELQLLLAGGAWFATMKRNRATMPEFDQSRDGEADVDREIRIEKIKRELEELSGSAVISGSVGDVPPELEEVFLERVCAWEKAPYDTNFNRLVQRGVEMMPPAELDDCKLRVKLQEVLCALATICCFLHDTDHLSDRELYTWLWSDGLREETPDLSQLGGAWHMSPIGSSTDEDIAIFLKYYASEKERHCWKADFPNDTLPPHCPLPYNRDRNLPRSE